MAQPQFTRTGTRTRQDGRTLDSFDTSSQANRDYLAQFATNAMQNRLLGMPSHDIEAFGDRLNVRMIPTRPSYLNAVLIQSRGQLSMCFQCRRNPVRGPFPECRTTDEFGGCCGNCKYRDHAARCEIVERESSDEEDEEEDESSDDGSTEEEEEESDEAEEEIEVEVEVEEEEGASDEGEEEGYDEEGEVEEVEGEEDE